VSSPRLDLEKIAALRDVMNTGVPEIVKLLLDGMTAAVTDAEAALGAGRLDEVGKAAHRGRNDALLCGATALQSALAELERAARRGETTQVREALARVHQEWLPTRAEMEQAAAEPG
jgi:HPt (histidine-containing phosphotransfer) domain-containing protein